METVSIKTAAKKMCEPLTVNRLIKAVINDGEIESVFWPRLLKDKTINSGRKVAPPERCRGRASDVGGRCRQRVAEGLSRHVCPPETCRVATDGRTTNEAARQAYLPDKPPGEATHRPAPRGLTNIRTPKQRNEKKPFSFALLSFILCTKGKAAEPSAYL